MCEEDGAHRSGFFSGLCSPDLGTARRLATKGSSSLGCVSGSRMKASPLSGSGMVLLCDVLVHSPLTAHII
jgi:hypothetical protein